MSMSNLLSYIMYNIHTEYVYDDDDGKDSERNEGFRPYKEAFTERAWKESEFLVLRLVPDEELLHTKIIIIVLQKISQKIHAV